MTALELLSDLRDRGVKLWVDGADPSAKPPRSCWRGTRPNWSSS